MKQALHKTGRVIMVVGLVGLLVVIVVYVAAVPQLLAADYAHRIGQFRTAIYQDFKTLAKTSESTIFSDYDGSYAKKKQELRRLEKTVHTTSESLGRFSSEADSLFGIMFIESIHSRYQRSLVAQEKMQNTVTQSREVLRNYTRLLDYLKATNEAQHVFEMTTAKINAVSNFDELAGQGQQIRAAASQLQKARTILAKQKPTFDFLQSHDYFLRDLQAAIDGLEQITVGLDTAVDMTIYDGVKTIEQATIRYDPGFKSLLFKALQESPVIEEVRQLPDKVEVFTV